MIEKEEDKLHRREGVRIKQLKRCWKGLKEPWCLGGLLSGEKTRNTPQKTKKITTKSEVVLTKNSATIILFQRVMPRSAN